MANDVRIRVSVTDDASPALRKVGQETDRLGTSAGGTGASMLSMGVAFAAVTAAATVAAGVLYSFYATNRDLELQLRKSTTVFAEQLPVVQAWADSNAAAMGLSSNQAINLAASMADLLIPMGMTRVAATDLATKTIGLSGALAEWSGGQRTAAEVASILQKAFLGETDGLKQLGIAISAEQVMAELATRGQQDLTGATLEQAKALAIQTLVFAKSADAQAAYAGGAGTAARAQAELTAHLKTAHEQMATALAPVIAAVAGALIGALIPAIDGLVVVFKFLVDHGTAVASALGGIATAITVLMIPKIIALTAATYVYVAALTAQAIALAMANPFLAAAAVIAGVATAAAIALALRTGDAAVATSKLAAEASALAPALDKAASSANALSKTMTDMSFAQLAAFIAAKALEGGLDDASTASGPLRDRLDELYERETKLKGITDALTESYTHANAIQAGLTAAKKADSEEMKRQAEGSKIMTDLVNISIAAYEKLQNTLTSLTGKFALMGDRARQAGFETVKAGFAAAGGNQGAALAAIQAGAAETARGIAEANALIGRAFATEGSVLFGDIAATNRALKAVQSGVPDPLLVELGLVKPLAHGGIVRARPGGTLALLGEGGRDEAVVPLGGSAGGMGGTVNVYLSGVITDPVATGRAVAAALNSASRTTGPLLLAGTVQ